MKDCISKILTISCLLAISNLAHGAKIQCWTNSDGVRECGHSVPPEYSQQKVEVLNEKGVVVDVKERAKTPEELAEAARLEEQRKQQEKILEEQRRKDQILLMTFSSERDLNLAHKNKLDAMNSIIELTRVSTRSLEEKLVKTEKRAANYERAGEKTPEALITEVQDLRTKIAENNQVIAEKEKKVEEAKKLHQYELTRFRQLKGIKDPDNSEKLSNK